MPRLGAWIEGQGPAVTIVGFPPQADLRIVNVHTDRDILRTECTTNMPISVPWPGPGTYLVEADCSTDYDQRLVKLIAWDDLPVCDPPHWESLRIGDAQVCGAAIDTVDRGAD